MCGRFELNISKDKLIQKFGIDNWQLDNYKVKYNIPPGTNITIIRNTGQGRIVSYANWGLIPSWSKDRKIAYKTFNARSETVAEKPSFRAAYKHNRCIIPTSGYYEWQKLDSKNKQPFWIGRADKEPFVMAGLFENWTDIDTGELLESVTVLTKEAYPEIAHIHNRMPVILPEEKYDDWLHCDLVDFPSIAVDEMNYYPISSDVGSPRNDHFFERVEL